VFSTPTVAGDLIIVGSCNGRIHALDKKTGQVKWNMTFVRTASKSQFHGDPLVADDAVVIGTDGTIGHHVYAFDRATGAVRWKYKVEQRGVASNILRLGRDIFFVTLGNNELISLDLQTGQRNWAFHAAAMKIRFSGRTWLGIMQLSAQV